MRLNKYNLRPRNDLVRIEGQSRKRPNGKFSESSVRGIRTRRPASSSASSRKKKNIENALHGGVSQKGVRGSDVNNRVQQNCPVAMEEEKGTERKGGLNDWAVAVEEENSFEGKGGDYTEQVDSDFEPQDADYSFMPGLNDELALLCLARASRAEYGKFFSINKRYLTLSQSGDLYKMRRKMGIYEQWVYMLASGEFEWRAFDPKSKQWTRLPRLPSDSCFAASDKESLCAGTQVLVLGREIEGLVIWRYELVTNQWFKGPSMITPRCLFASASCANFAFVAGGFRANGEILKCAEMYDPDKKTWERLPDMHKARKLCSGCFMDNKFYVIGGTSGGTGEVEDLTCGEFYDTEKKIWELIPDMVPQSSSSSIARAPPLVAVVNNELYALDASTNQLKFYIKQTNKWKVLGQVPVRADCNSGWGVAFKSLGDQLLLMGGTNGYGISIYTSHPEPNKSEATWHFLTRVVGSVGPFVFNCAIMST